MIWLQLMDRMGCKTMVDVCVHGVDARQQKDIIKDVCLVLCCAEVDFIYFFLVGIG